MAKLKYAFQRKEKKYLLSTEKYQLLRERVAAHMSLDQYGRHTISSIYYDTEDYQMIRQSLDKPEYREKFRVRAYGNCQKNSQVFMEIKKKFVGVVYKRRIAVDYPLIDQFNQENDLPDFEKTTDTQIAHEINWLFKTKELSPKVMIAYDREALFDPTDDDFRITFDFNMRWRDRELDLSQGSHGEKIAPEIDVLMEVKALGAYPRWFADILTELAIYPGSFTKFGETYKRYLYKKEELKYVI